MKKTSEKKKSNAELRKDKDLISERVKDYLVRAHSFQEVGTELLPNEDYDILHFPQLILAVGVIMSMYGYFIIYISTDFSAYLDGLVILIVGTFIATIGMLRLLAKYWSSFLILIVISLGIILLMMVLWDFVLVPFADAQGSLPDSFKSEQGFTSRVLLVILTTTTFAYTASFIWMILARYTSMFYFKIFARGKSNKNQYFIVDPWRKTLANKGQLITDILGRIYYPFLFLLSLITSLSDEGELYFVQIEWSNYFEAVLLMYALLSAMVVLFPALWLLDYVRYYDEERLEVKSLANRVLILIYGYAGFTTIIWFVSRGDFLIASMEFFMVSMYLVPSLILLIGSYILLTERDVYYIAEKVPHGDKVVVEYKLIDSKGKELKWWLQGQHNKQEENKK